MHNKLVWRVIGFFIVNPSGIKSACFGAQGRFAGWLAWLAGWIVWLVDGCRWRKILDADAGTL
jgi:hypothetical protein